MGVDLDSHFDFGDNCLSSVFFVLLRLWRRPSAPSSVCLLSWVFGGVREGGCGCGQQVYSALTGSGGEMGEDEPNGKAGELAIW